MTAHASTTMSPQLQRLLVFLRWATPITFIFAALYSAIALISANLLVGITGVVGFAFGGLLLIARHNANQGYITRAAALISSGQLGASIVIVLAVPSLYPALVLVPLLAIVIALPYIQGAAMLRLIAVSALVAALVGILGAFVDLLNTPPPEYVSLVLVGMLIMTIALIALLLWQFSSHLNETLVQAKRANEDLTTSNAALGSANQRLNDQLEQQRKLVDLVSTLETPAVALADYVLLAPIVGHIDGRRAQLLTERLLRTVGAMQTKLVIIDIAGVPVVDTSVAQGLIQAAQALQLLGCQVRLSGITAQVAATLVGLGISLDAISPVRSPQDALAEYLQR